MASNIIIILSKENIYEVNEGNFNLICKKVPPEGYNLEISHEAMYICIEYIETLGDRQGIVKVTSPDLLGEIYKFSVEYGVSPLTELVESLVQQYFLMEVFSIEDLVGYINLNITENKPEYHTERFAHIAMDVLMRFMRRTICYELDNHKEKRCCCKHNPLMHKPDTSATEFCINGGGLTCYCCEHDPSIKRYREAFGRLAPKCKEILFNTMFT